MVTITIDPRSIENLRVVAKEMPQDFAEANRRAIAGAKRQFSSIMRNGGKPDAGVPKFAKPSRFTQKVKAAAGVKSYKSKGGEYKSAKLFDGAEKRFATDDRYHVAFRKGNAWFIGFPDSIWKFMGNLLEPNNHPFAPEVKRYMHANYKDIEVPEMYERPQRHIIEPWGERLAGGMFAKWITGNLKKTIRRKYGLIPGGAK